MNLQSCSVRNCSRTDIVAMQKQIQMISISPPRTNNSNESNDQTSHTEKIVFQYFCKIHFDVSAVQVSIFFFKFILNVADNVR